MYFSRSAYDRLPKKPFARTTKGEALRCLLSQKPEFRLLMHSAHEVRRLLNAGPSGQDFTADARTNRQQRSASHPAPVFGDCFKGGMPIQVRERRIIIESLRDKAGVGVIAQKRLPDVNQLAGPCADQMDAQEPQ
jgi:predicted phage tail protein